MKRGFFYQNEKPEFARKYYPRRLGGVFFFTIKPTYWISDLEVTNNCFLFEAFKSSDHSS